MKKLLLIAIMAIFTTGAFAAKKNEAKKLIYNTPQKTTLECGTASSSTDAECFTFTVTATVCDDSMDALTAGITAKLLANKERAKYNAICAELADMLC